MPTMHITKKNIKYWALGGHEGPFCPFSFDNSISSNPEWGCAWMGAIHLQSNPTLEQEVLMKIEHVVLSIRSEENHLHHVAISLSSSTVLEFPR